jgi:subtilisin family serine protease
VENRRINAVIGDSVLHSSERFLKVAIMNIPLQSRFPALALAGLLGAASAFAAGGGNSGRDANMPGEIMVKLTGSSALQPLLASYPVTLMASMGPRPIYRLKVTGNSSTSAVLGALALEPTVQFAELNPLQQSPEARKNVAWAIGSPDAYRTQWAPQAMHLAEAQKRSLGAGVRVAVLDTGVDFSHPALAGRLLPGYDFVDGDPDASEGGSAANPAFGHGTHVAGLVALAAPAAKILPLRVLDANGVGNVWTIAAALLYAVDPDGDPSTDDGAQVVNLSLGTLNRTRIFDTLSKLISCSDLASADPALDVSDAGYAGDRSRCSRKSGALIVAAAGNDASGSVKQYPAAEGAYGLLPMAASDARLRIASFSNFGSWIQSAAPGDGITSSVPGGLYATWSGTSMAAPLAAGTAALVRANEPTLTPKELINRLQRSAAALCGSSLRLVDALAAVGNTAPAPLVCK